MELPRKEGGKTKCDRESNICTKNGMSIIYSVSRMICARLFLCLG